MRIIKIALLGFGLISGLFAQDIKIYIIHGVEANTESYWYPWLKSELSSVIGGDIKAENIVIPALPNKPEMQLWKDKIKEVVGTFDEKTYLVTHGVSGIAALKFIEESGQKLGGIVLVSGFVKATQNTQNISSFTATRRS